MRKVVLAMMTTLNGRVDDPEAWMSGVGNDLYADIDRAYDTYDTVLVGQTTYQEMYEYWPGAETEDAPIGGLSDAAPATDEAAEVNKRMARKMNAYKKYVFSSGREKRTLEWTNCEPVVVRLDAELEQFVADLKAQPGKDIHLAGGARLAQTFVRLGLVDEYRFYVHPVASPGKTVFDQLEGRRGLELVSATPYADGAIGLYYKPRIS
jgi:dihydrofolate reductase